MDRDGNGFVAFQEFLMFFKNSRGGDESEILMLRVAADGAAVGDAGCKFKFNKSIEFFGIPNFLLERCTSVPFDLLLVKLFQLPNTISQFTSLHFNRLIREIFLQSSAVRVHATKKSFQSSIPFLHQ